MNPLISTSDRQAHWGLLALRLVVGFIMLYAGWQKLFNFGVDSFAQALTAEGVPLAQLFAWGVTLLELVGGALIIVGLLSRPLALLMSVDMVVAILLVTHEVGFMSATGKSGAEVNLLLIGGFLAILLAGPGSLSVDRAMEARGAGARAAEAL